MPDVADDLREAKRHMRALTIKEQDMTTEMRSIASKDPDKVTDRDDERFSNLEKARTRVLDQIGAAREQVRAAEAGFRSGISGTVPGVAYPEGTRERREQEARATGRPAPSSESVSRALSLLETETRSTHGGIAAMWSARQLDHMDALLRSENDQTEGGYLAERMALTECPEYRSAWRKLVSEPRPVFTAPEANSLNEYRSWQRRNDESEYRAASEGTGSAGGYGIPVLIDPTIILSSGALEAPILAISRVVTITTDAWKGVTAPGATWTYVAEAGVVTDGTPTMVQPSIPVVRASGFIPYSIEIGQDYPGFAEEMSRLLSQGYVDLLAKNTMTGAGTGNTPTGIFTALAATTASQLEVTTSGTLGGIDVRTLWSNVPERFRPHATWLMNNTVMALVRGLGNNLSLSDYTVNLSAGDPEYLEGKPVVLTDYAPSYGGSTTGVENYMVVGDFSNFLIVQRAGMTLELVPQLFDTSTGRPTGQRGWFAWARHGYNSVNNNAFRMLVNTTAGLNQ